MPPKRLRRSAGGVRRPTGSGRGGSAYDRQVFLNVPFDSRYRKLFHALIFTIEDLGLVARCAREKDDSGQVRIEKLLGMIRGCRFGVHDLSRTSLDSRNRLPRFNMPLELGIFLGARAYGARLQPRKACVVLERDEYRYQKFCSDIAGQDIRAHGNQADRAIAAVRDWLQTHVGPGSRPWRSTTAIARRYIAFRRDLPAMCRRETRRASELTFIDYRQFVRGWIRENQTA